MKIKRIFSFLISPGKNQEDPSKPIGTDIPLNGKLFEMLKEIFDRSERECNIPIVFKPNENGDQANEVRSDILKFLSALQSRTAKVLQID